MNSRGQRRAGKNFVRGGKPKAPTEADPNCPWRRGVIATKFPPKTPLLEPKVAAACADATLAGWRNQLLTGGTRQNRTTPRCDNFDSGTFSCTCAAAASIRIYCSPTSNGSCRRRGGDDCLHGCKQSPVDFAKGYRHGPSWRMSTARSLCIRPITDREYAKLLLKWFDPATRLRGAGETRDSLQAGCNRCSGDHAIPKGVALWPAFCGGRDWPSAWGDLPRWYSTGSSPLGTAYQAGPRDVPSASAAMGQGAKQARTKAFYPNGHLSRRR